MVTRRLLAVASTVGLCAIAAFAPPVQALPGDTSHADTVFLDGSLLGLDATLVASIGVEEADSDGTASETNSGNLDLGVLGLRVLDIGGGVQVPLALTDAGVVGQYASALSDGSSVAASGLVASDGAIGTGITPAPGVAPGPLRLSLGDLVADLGLSPALLAEIAELDLTVDGVAARASQAAPGTATGDYAIADVGLEITSPTVAAVGSTVTTTVATAETGIAGLDGVLETTLGGLLGGLGLIDVDVTVGASGLTAAVAPFLAAPVSDPTYPGVTVDLNSGLITVDLDEIIALEGQPADTDVLTSAQIATIVANITGLTSSVLADLDTAIEGALDAITVTGGVQLLGLDIVTIDTTLGDLADGTTTGISVVGAALPFELAILSGLLADVTGVVGALSGLGGGLATTIASDLGPALDPVLSAALALTVNSQSTTAGAFTETALRVTLLPGTGALTLDIGNATVGPNSLAPAATASTITPDTGPDSGGTAVTITGSGFTNATAATFDGTPGTSFTVVDDSTITTVTPAHAPGAVDVVVESPRGDSAPLTFTYVPDDAIAVSLDPTEGPDTGGTTVTITGSNFTPATAATFDGTPGTSFTIVDDSTITVVSPPHAPGAVDVVVESPLGDADPLTFTYLESPVALSLDPTEGPDTGGTTVTISGSGFVNATGVTFDGTPGSSFTVVDDDEITVVSPAHAPGAVDVVVQSPLGDTGPLTFTYLESPVALSLDPNSGPDDGGTTVTISGTGFVNATGVTFDGTPGSSFTVVDDDEITVVSPAHAPGAVDVVVQSPLGDADPLTFTYLDDAADAVSITPGSGPESGGTAVTITGSNFTGATGVTFDGIAGTSFVVVDDSTITASTPPHAPGSVSVIVQQSGGDSNALAFDYLPDPASATSLTPTSGPEDGGTTVTITGSGFDEATSATFDGVAGTAFTVVDDTTISVATPPHAPGPVDVVVTSPYGDSAPLTFTYVPGPADATSIDPATGPEVGATAVTISGDNFTDATAATFDGTPGTSFTVVSDDEITVVSPPHAPGPVDVVVRSAFGDAAPLTFTYTSVAASATSLTPASGPDTGGTTVTITGTNLTHATGVTFDGTAGTSFTVVDDTTVRVVTPAGTRGPVDVIVVSPYGDGGPLAFTYIGATRVATIDPPQGPTSGGTTVTITGVCFTGAIDVTFDGVSATGFTVVDDTTITAVTPAHAAASVDVVVIGSAVCSGEPLAATYLYVDPAPETTTTTTTIPEPAPDVELPATGSGTTSPLLAGGLLLGLGLTLTVWTRRRTTI